MEPNEYKNFQPYDNSTPEWSLKGMLLAARVVNIYDGDTCKIVVRLFDNKYIKFDTRLVGIDTCEMHSKNAKIQTLALKARNRLFQLVSGETEKPVNNTYLQENVCLVQVRCGDFDKYGRLLAEIFPYKSNENPDDIESTSFSSILCKEKLAYAYNGEKKLTEDEQLLVLKLTDS
jgi:endonuclease YncB( thermonuclease family)